MFSSTKRNTVFKQLFYMYSRFYIILLLILILLFLIISNTFITNSNLLLVSNALEKSTNNMTYMLQQNVNLAWSLAKEDDVKRGVANFINTDASGKIDSDIYLTEVFYSYWKSNPEISKIRVFFERKESEGTTAYKTIDFINSYNEEWKKYFQQNSGVIVTDYTYDSESHNIEKIDEMKVAVIIPINISDKTVAFLDIDIDKKKLFTKYITDLEHKEDSSILVYNTNGKIVYNDEKVLGLEDDLGYNIIDNEKYIKDKIRFGGETYNLFCTEKTAHDFRVVQLIPSNKMDSHKFPLFALIVLVVIFALCFTVIFSKRRAKQFVTPLIELEKAMVNLEPIEIKEKQTVEIFNIFESYNNLLKINNTMIENVKKSDQKQKDAEIKALLAQISPHFLYNTLNVIMLKAANANQPEISSIVDKLAKLCRTRYNFTSEFIPVSEEVEHIEYYMQLQKECFKNKFDYEINIEKSFIQFYVPRFILQPIVENSILHGFYQIGRKGYISVKAYADEDLLIEVTDNGSGINNDIIVKLNNNRYKSEKYGLRNINQRIKLLCGDRYGMTFQSDGCSSTVVKILLPIKFDSQEGEG